MESSYYITCGSNRLPFPGDTGSVVWDYVPSYADATNIEKNNVITRVVGIDRK